MRILIIEDDRTTGKLLQMLLVKWGYEVEIIRDGDEAWKRMQSEDAPRLILLDRILPGIGGLEICRRIRELDSGDLTYVIHLTTMSAVEDIVEGFEAGANDYVTKPFSNSELKARVSVGERMVKLQTELASRVEELEEALAYIKKLHGVLPICSYCHKIRDEKDSWQRLEAYIQDRSDATFSHSFCPECLEKHYPESLD